VLNQHSVALGSDQSTGEALSGNTVGGTRLHPASVVTASLPRPSRARGVLVTHDLASLCRFCPRVSNVRSPAVRVEVHGTENGITTTASVNDAGSVASVTARGRFRYGILQPAAGIAGERPGLAACVIQALRLTSLPITRLSVAIVRTPQCRGGHHAAAASVSTVTS